MMISANKILLQRLSATPTLQRIGRNQLSCRAVRWNSISISRRVVNPKISVQRCLPATTAFGKNALFSTSMETQTDLTGEEDKDASSSTEPNDAIEDASEKKDDAAPPLEEVSAEAETTGSNDTKSADSQTDLPGDDEKDASSSTGSNDDIEDASEKKEDTKSADSTDAKYYRGVRVENVIRTGKIHWVSNQKKRCTIVQDRKYRDIGPLKAAKVTVSFPMFNPILHKIDDDYWKPTIAEGRRVQFQAKKQKGGGDYLVGFNVRYEGGRDIPMLNLRGSVALIKKAKAALGHSVYNVLSESALSAEGEGDIAKKVKLEFDKHNRRMAEAREQSGDPSKTSKEIKAKLGDEIYDLITNIATVDSIERRADDAYYRCVKKLQELGLSIEPSITKDKGDKLGYKGFFERTKPDP